MTPIGHFLPQVRVKYKSLKSEAQKDGRDFLKFFESFWWKVS